MGTLVLWHLDEPAAGQVILPGAGDLIPNALGATSSTASSAVPDGPFGFGRKRAGLVASAGFDTLEPTNSSFTVECWVRTQPVDRAYNLVARSDSEWETPEFGVVLLNTGVLRALLYDSANRAWTMDVPVVVYDQVAGSWKRCILTTDSGISSAWSSTVRIHCFGYTWTVSFGAQRLRRRDLRVSAISVSGSGPDIETSPYRVAPMGRQSSRAIWTRFGYLSGRGPRMKFGTTMGYVLDQSHQVGAILGGDRRPSTSSPSDIRLHEPPSHHHSRLITRTQQVAKRFSCGTSTK